jgi:hypothetical protein
VVNRTEAIESALLRSVIRTHEEATRQLDKLVKGLSAGQANWTPGPKVWSVAQCIDHLDQALGTYIGKMEPAITKAREAGQMGSEPYGRGTLVGRLLVGFLGQPGKTVRAPGVFQPGSSHLDLNDVVEEFRQRSAKMIELAEEADGLDLGRIRIATPVSPFLRLSLAQAFEVHILHTPRHLAQADRVRRQEGFPTS